jgi:hypothetical protein
MRPPTPTVKLNATRTRPPTTQAAPGSPSTVAKTAPRARPDIHLATTSAPLTRSSAPIRAAAASARMTTSGSSISSSAAN